MRSTRLWITLFFLADGLVVGSWAARIPAVQQQADLTTSKLGLALLAMAAGALVAMPAAGWLSERFGSRSVTVAALAVASVSLVLASLAGGPGSLALALAALGGGVGGVNVAANAQGLALERRSGRSILSSFHAAFSVGALVGAGVGALAAGAAVGPTPHFAAMALVLGSVALVGGRHLLPPPRAESVRAPVFALPPRGLLVLGAAAFFTMLAEGAAADWSAVYLGSSLGTTAGVAALGYTGFALGMATSRTIGDRLYEHFGAVALARGGGLLAATALTFALIGGVVPAALVGLVAMGAGIGVVVPVLFRAAGSTRGVGTGVGLSAVSTVGWLGFLAGPPLIGFAADSVGLRAALLIVVVAIGMVVALAGSAGPGRSDEIPLPLPFEPRAVLSDLDGVLVDSGAAIVDTWRRFAARHGLDPEHVLANSHGRRTVDLIRIVAPHLDADSEAARVEQEEIASAGSLRALPGAHELVQTVPSDRFAIVTSGSRQLAVARLQAAGLPVPDVLVTAEDVESGKPDPAGYLRAAARLGVEPAHSLVVEDAPAGVDAGLSAGMNVVAVLTTNDESALRAAHRRVPDLRALLPVTT